MTKIWLWAAAALAAMGVSARADQAKIGVLNDQSGLYAEFGGAGSVTAAQMAVEDFGGSVLGSKIEVVSADHQNKADVGSAIARKWFDVDGVTAIADLTNSAVALAVQGLAKDKNKITLFSGPASTRLFNEDCSPTGFMWTFDTYAMANGTAKSIVKTGGDTWYLLTADYAFGQQLARDIESIVSGLNGKVVGSTKHPVNTADFSSFLVAAQSSKAKIVGLSNAGADTINAIKQAGEFGVVEGGQKLAALVVVISDIHALGLAKAKGLIATTAFYHDSNDATRAWSKRYFDKTGRMPGMVQAGVYSSVLHYLRAVKSAGSTDGAKVAEAMRAAPVDDFFAPGAKIREDGRLMNDMMLIEVKTPAESKAPWDYFKIVRAIPAAELLTPLADSKCPLVKK